MQKYIWEECMTEEEKKKKYRNDGVLLA